MKKEWKWLTAFGLMSILIIGLMTDFKFKDLEIQMHDTYFIIGPIKAFIFLTLILFTIKNFYWLVDFMTDRYKIIALLVSVINPIIGLFVLMLIYFNIQVVVEFKQMYPDSDFIRLVIPICVLVGLITLQTIIEIRTLRKLWGFLNNDKIEKTAR